MKLTVFLVFALACLPLVLPAEAAAKVQGKEIAYSAGGVQMKGYLAWDDSITGKRPGILVVHEWWGHNEYVRKRARMLAELGYAALALDMYGQGKQAAHPQDAGKFAGEVMKNLELMTLRFNAALDLLKQQSMVDTAKIGAVGYCFGGGVVLNMALRGSDLSAVASFHGSLALPPDHQHQNIKTNVFIANGAADTFVTAEQVATMTEELAKGGRYWQFISYQGVKHGFTNPEADNLAAKFQMPIAYDAGADKDSWEQMQRFFSRTFSHK